MYRFCLSSFLNRCLICIFSSLLYVSSLGWLQDGSHLVCATDNGRMQIWDVEKVKMIRNLRTDDNERIGAMSFRSHMLTEGNRLGTLRHHDLRIADHEIMKREAAHAQEVTLTFYF